MTSKRSISGREFIADIRSGMTAAEMINKYGLNEEELTNLFVQLEGAGAKPLQLYGRSPLNLRGRKNSRIRFSPRHEVPCPIPVTDTGHTDVEGVLVDITEHGLCVRGIETYVTEMRNLTIRPESFLSVKPIPLRAICRWVGQTGDPTNYAAGFRITHISEEGSRELRKMIGLMILPEIELDERAGIYLDDPLGAAIGSGNAGWTCPFCRTELLAEPDECPQCGIVPAEYQGGAFYGRSPIKAPVQDDSLIPPAETAEDAPSVNRTISVPEKTWKELESLDGEVNDHVIRALADYLLKNRSETRDSAENRALTR